MLGKRGCVVLFLVLFLSVFVVSEEWDYLANDVLPKDVSNYNSVNGELQINDGSPGFPKYYDVHYNLDQNGYNLCQGESCLPGTFSLPYESGSAKQTVFLSGLQEKLSGQGFTDKQFSEYKLSGESSLGEDPCKDYNRPLDGSDSTSTSESFENTPETEYADGTPVLDESHKMSSEEKNSAVGTEEEPGADDPDEIACRMNQVLGGDPDNEESVDSESYNNMLELFKGLDSDKRNEVWSSGKLTAEEKQSFFENWAKENEVEGVFSFGDSADLSGDWTVDDDGNMKFTSSIKGYEDDRPGPTIDFTAIKEFKSGGPQAAQKLTFDGEDYTGSELELETVSFGEGGSVSYNFKDNVKVNLESADVSFDLEKQLFTDEKSDLKYNWVNNKGHITVNGDGNIELSLSAGSDGVSSNFPVLIGDGVEHSPYMFKDDNQKLPSGFEVPKDGYKAYEENGINYVVDSKNVKRRVTSALIKPGESDEDPLKLSNAFYNNQEQKSGRIFTGEDTTIVTGNDISDEVKTGNYVHIKKNGDSFDLAMKSEGSKAYYDQQGDLETVSLEGDVTFRNGNGIVEPSKEGLKFRKDKKDGADFSHAIANLQGAGSDEKFNIKDGVLKSADKRLTVSTGSAAQQAQQARQSTTAGGATQTPSQQQGGDDPTQQTPSTGSQTQQQPQYITNNQDPNYKQGVYGGVQYVKYNTVDYVKNLANQRGSVQVTVTEPAHCPYCRKKSDPNKLYLTSSQAKQLGYTVTGIPTTINVRGN